MALCPELDVASQGDTVEEAKKNLLITDLYRCGRKGSYIVMQKKTENRTITVPVPNHSEIKRGTLQSIIRQPEIPSQYFEIN